MIGQERLIAESEIELSGAAGLVPRIVEEYIPDPAAAALLPRLIEHGAGNIAPDNLLAAATDTKFTISVVQRC